MDILAQEISAQHRQHGQRAKQRSQKYDDNGHTAKDRESGLDAYIKELVDAAPPLTSEQRDTLALLLRRPRRR